MRAPSLEGKEVYAHFPNSKKQIQLPEALAEFTARSLPFQERHHRMALVLQHADVGVYVKSFAVCCSSRQ